jgi:hypothetical protein
VLFRINTAIYKLKYYTTISRRVLYQNQISENDFSYYYCYDYIIDFDSIENIETGEKIEIFDLNSTEFKDKKRTNKVEFSFKTTSASPYRITLKMGKGLNNVNCKYRYTTLANLTLYDKNKHNSKVNLAQDYTHANGNVSWSTNSDAYDIHIDR